jgi:hypothetical protein
MLLLLGCLFKIQKEKRAGLQFTSTDYLSFLLTPLRIRWTIPLGSVSASMLWAGGLRIGKYLSKKSHCSGKKYKKWSANRKHYSLKVDGFLLHSSEVEMIAELFHTK